MSGGKKACRKDILDQETQVLKLAVESPGKWTLSKLSKELDIPTSTLKYRVHHLRAAGYFVPVERTLTVTDEGRVAYYKRARPGEL
tara:strand:+ start:1050 stop:1307 length:258 start_codon:yes stop_codon:yes gene_type:complete